MATLTTVPLLIDCDTGIDDALALLYATASPDAEIVGVSCVAGNVGLADIVRNTLAVLELAGRGDVPVAAGAERPLARPLRTAPDTHGPTGLGYAELPVARARTIESDGPAAIIDAVRARPGELTLVTLGPLTNVALALGRAPDLPMLVHRLVMMVGSYRSPGNTAPTMEWNAGVDPEALAAVLEGWRRGRMERPAIPRPWAFGLDVTERARMTPAHLEKLASRAGSTDTPMIRFVADALRFYFEFHSRHDGFYGAFIHDALVVAAALDATLARSVPLAVEVELEGRWTSGETVADWRRAWSREADVDIAIETDSERFFDQLVERLGALAAARAAEAVT